ncbi:hypothetical protein QQ045_008853 [Rhodiola kirilowii]
MKRATVTNASLVLAVMFFGYAAEICTARSCLSQCFSDSVKKNPIFWEYYYIPCIAKCPSGKSANLAKTQLAEQEKCVNGCEGNVLNSKAFPDEA